MVLMDAMDCTLLFSSYLKGLRVLALTHREGDTVTVTAGEYTIKVKIIDVRGNRVRIGWDAPIDVQIHRDELGEFNPTLSPTRKDIDNE